MITSLLAVGTSVGTGIASAVVPVVNAEAATVAGAIASPFAVAVLIALGIAVGQTIGKWAMYEGARRGVEQHRSRRAPTPREQMRPWRRRLAAYNDRLLALMQGRWRSNGVLFASASLGMPPLLATTVVAGAARTRRLDFVVCCLTGRAARFFVVAAPFVLR